LGRLSSPFCKNILIFRRRKSLHSPPLSRPTRGAYRDRHERGAGCGGRGGAADERHPSGRRSRVVLTPRRWRQVRGGNFAGDGDNQARSPRRARRKPLKPLRAGMPGDFRCDRCEYSCAYSLPICAHEAAGASGIRHSPRPLSGERILATTRTHCVAGSRRRVSPHRRPGERRDP